MIFLYRLTCPKTRKFYIGVHGTNKLDDGYEGSGLWPKRYVKKHGKQVLEREILQFFESYEGAYSAERELLTSELTKPLCMNITAGGIGFTSERARELRLGMTADMHEGTRKTAEALRGRTKFTHDYLATLAKKLSEQRLGVTAEASPRVAKMAASMANRSKATSKSVAAQAEKISGRTKYTHAGVRQQSLKMAGRSQESHEGIAKSAAGKRKLELAQICKIRELHDGGLSFKAIKDQLSVEVSIGTIQNAYHGKHQAITVLPRTSDYLNRT
jgi:hypothetical protein